MPAAGVGPELTTCVPGASCWGDLSICVFPSPGAVCVVRACAFTSKLEAGPAGQQGGLGSRLGYQAGGMSRGTCECGMPVG